MRIYEVLFIIAPNTEADVVDSLVTQFSDIATNQGATMTNVNRMGLRRLAYPIQKFNEGIYVVLTIQGSGAEIAEIERRLRVSDAVIRYITVRIDEELKRAGKMKARSAARAANRAGGSHRSNEPATAGFADTEEEEEEL
jgi:small subunit ribosomal protein S6